MSVLLACVLACLAGSPSSRPASRPTSRPGPLKMAFSLDQGFGNGIIANKDLAAASRMAQALATLRPHCDPYALLNPQVADQATLRAVLNVLAAHDVPFLLEACSSDAMTLGTTTTQCAPADGRHGVAMSADDMTRLKAAYPAHFAGVRIMEMFSQDFTVRAVRTTNPEWNTAGWKLPEGPFFRSELIRPFVRIAHQEHMFVLWSDWHWHAFSPWDAGTLPNERAMGEMIAEFPGTVILTFANNQPQRAADRLLRTWHEPFIPLLSQGAAGLGLSNQAWLNDPETACPIEDLVSWGDRAVEVGAVAMQFEPAWYFFQLPRGTFGYGRYTDDPRYAGAGKPTPAFERLREALCISRR